LWISYSFYILEGAFFYNLENRIYVYKFDSVYNDLSTFYVFSIEGNLLDRFDPLAELLWERGLTRFLNTFLLSNLLEISVFKVSRENYFVNSS
jgi:hypothetical protein